MWLYFIENLKLVWIFKVKVHVHTKAFHVKVQSCIGTHKGTKPRAYKGTSLIYVGNNHNTGGSSKNTCISFSNVK